MKPTVSVGVDLGGTNLRVALVDRHARIRAHDRCRVDAERGPEAVLSYIIRSVDALLERAGLSRSGILGVGVGAPGPLSHRSGRILRTANLPGWNDVSVCAPIEKQLGKPVLLENDGNAAAFGEYWAGADESTDDLVLLTLGTGVGAGVILGGRVLHGHFENAAELGHMIVSVDGLPCACGQRGCLEQYASASGLVRRALAAIDAGEASSLSDVVRAKPSVEGKDIFACARDGDALCFRIWEEASRYLAIACINMQHAYNVPRILLGGGMSEAGGFLLDRVRNHVARQRWSLHDDLPEISLATLGSDAGVIGAAGLAWQANVAHGETTLRSKTPD